MGATFGRDYRVNLLLPSGIASSGSFCLGAIHWAPCPCITPSIAMGFFTSVTTRDVLPRSLERWTIWISTTSFLGFVTYHQSLVVPASIVSAVCRPARFVLPKEKGCVLLAIGDQRLSRFGLIRNGPNYSASVSYSARIR